MTEWQKIMAGGLASLAVALIYQIYLEVRSIRRMMNRDRDIPHE